MRAIIESMAQSLADLSLVGPAHWLLRILAAACSVLAFAIAIGSPTNGTVAALLALLLLIIGLIWASVRPDQEGPLLVLAAIVPGAAFRSELGLVPAVIAAVLVLVAHQCWAMSALTPVYSRFTRSAWSLVVRFFLLTVLVSAVVGAVIVLPGTLVHGGAWWLVLAAIAVIVLLTMLLPKPRVITE